MSDLEESEVEFRDSDALSSIGHPEHISDSSSSSSSSESEDDDDSPSAPVSSGGRDGSTVVPYAYAPMFTDAEIQAQEASREGGTSPTASSAAIATGATSDSESPSISRPGEVSAEEFCRCGKCTVMPKRRENVCCYMKNTTTSRCLTEDPEVQGSVLCKLTLEAIAMQERYIREGRGFDFQGFSLNHKECRFLAYRQASWNLHRAPLGDGNRIPLPSCVVTAVLEKFPLAEGESRVGFRLSAKQRCQRASLL